MKKTIGITAALYILIIWLNQIPSEYYHGPFFYRLIGISIFVAIFLFLGFICTLLIKIFFKDDSEAFKKAARFGFPLPLMTFFLGQFSVFIQTLL